MRSGTMCFLLIATIATATIAGAQSSEADLWNVFEATRQSPRALHQQFEVTTAFATAFNKQVSHTDLVLDLSQGKWREERKSGSGEYTRIFDGQDLFSLHSAESEYIRANRKADKDENLPEPYDMKLDWHKAKEVRKLPCGYAREDHDCVVVDVPVKPWIRMGLPGEVTKMSGGTARLMIDPVTGVWLACHVSASIAEASGFSYQSDITYSATHMSYINAPDAALFKLPATDVHEVKRFTHWDESRLKKELVDKPAPELRVKDLHGDVISLSELKGKTVLLDFWTTWCPPCRADAPELDRLNEKYGKKNLAIVSISVDEDRQTVESYLQKHPHDFPVALTTENSLPPQYQMGVYPTYLIISPDGVLAAAEQGDQGFRRLRKALEKAGMQTE